MSLSIKSKIHNAFYGTDPLMGTDLIIRSPPLDGIRERKMRLMEKKQLHETKKGRKSGASRRRNHG